MSKSVPVLHIVGSKNSGKTRLMEWLVKNLSRRGVRVGALKHSMHTHPVDKPAADSDRFRKAGAYPAAFWSQEGLGIYFPPLNTQEGWQILQTVFSDRDLILVESFASSNQPKIALVGESDDWHNFSHVVALVASRTVTAEYPVFKMRDPKLLDFILSHFVSHPRK